MEIAQTYLHAIWHELLFLNILYALNNICMCVFGCDDFSFSLFGLNEGKNPPIMFLFFPMNFTNNPFINFYFNNLISSLSLNLCIYNISSTIFFPIFTSTTDHQQSHYLSHLYVKSLISLYLFTFTLNQLIFHIPSIFKFGMIGS